MGLFNFDQNELITFFIVMVRFSVLIAMLPFVGDALIPAPIKVLLGVAFSFIVYPVLVSAGKIDPTQAYLWASSSGSIATTVFMEVIFALALGFTSRIVFDAIAISGDIAGSFMGFSAASLFDPFQNTQTQVISKLIYALSMLTFLAIDGHYIMFRAALSSYDFVGIGKVAIGAEFGNFIIEFSSHLIRLGLQLAAPMAVSFFGINIVYAILARAMPQMNILILSFSVSALVGIFVLTASLPEFNSALVQTFGDLGDTLGGALHALSGR